MLNETKKHLDIFFFYSTLSLAPHTLSISSSCWWSPYPEITKSVPLFVCSMIVQTRSPSSLPLDNCSNFLTVWLFLLSILHKEDFSFNFVHQWLFLAVGIQSKNSMIAYEALQDLALLSPTCIPFTHAVYLGRPNSCLPQGVCTWCWLCQKCSSHWYFIHLKYPYLHTGPLPPALTISLPWHIHCLILSVKFIWFLVYILSPSLG